MDLGNACAEQRFAGRAGRRAGRGDIVDERDAAEWDRALNGESAAYTVAMDSDSRAPRIRAWRRPLPDFKPSMTAVSGSA